MLATILSSEGQLLTKSSDGLYLSHFLFTAKQEALSGGSEKVLEAKPIELHCFPDCSYLTVAAL